MLSMVRQYFYEACYLVILNQSTSVQPPSLVTIAGRVQNIPTLSTDPFAFFYLERFAQWLEFLSVEAVTKVAHYQQVVSAFALGNLFPVRGELGTQVNRIIL